MNRMLPEIETVAQHQDQLRDNPDTSDPSAVPAVERGACNAMVTMSVTPHAVKVWPFCWGRCSSPRFYCPKCHRTCSRLPACLSPRRQYWWEIQQAVLERLISGESIRAVARQMMAGRRTIGRWWQWLVEEFDTHSLHRRFPELGRAVDWKAFWSHCFDQMSLDKAMGWLDRIGVRVP